MQATSPTFYGTVTLNGRISCSPVTGRKIDIYDDGATIYGFGLNDFEYCVFGGQGSAFTYRIATPGATDLAGEIALFVNATGVGIPVGRPISWGSNTLLVDAAGTLLVNGAPVGGGGGAYNPAAVAITGGSISGVSYGTGVNTLSLTGAATGAAPSVAPAGTAANIDLALSAKGTGAVSLGAGTGTAARFTAPANAANHFLFAGTVAGTGPTLNVAGPDADIAFSLAAKGGAGLYFYAAQALAAALTNPAAAVNNVALRGAAAGASPTISAAGSDTNVSLTLAGKGTGVVVIPAVDIEGGGIDNTPIGNTTPSTLRGTTLSLTGSQTAKFVLAAPNAAAGAPAWRQMLYTDLSGFPQQTAATGLTASTTNTQAGALALTAAVNNITTAAANSAVRLPNAAPATGFAAEIVVRNGGANAVNCFPPSGASINALAANAAFSLAAGASVRFQQLTATLYITA